MTEFSTWETEVELNSSETAETRMISEEPRQRPARVKVEEAAMKKWDLVSWARTVRTEETSSRLNPMMAISRQYLGTKHKISISSGSNFQHHSLISGSITEQCLNRLEPCRLETCGQWEL